MIRPRIRETIAALDRAARSAGLGFDGLDRILLVGGSSRIPLVAEMVRESTHRPIALDAHPKHTMALGAAWIAERSRREADGTAPGAVLAGAAVAGVVLAGAVASAASRRATWQRPRPRPPRSRRRPSRRWPQRRRLPEARRQPRRAGGSRPSRWLGSPASSWSWWWRPVRSPCSPAAATGAPTPGASVPVVALASPSVVSAAPVTPSPSIVASAPPTSPPRPPSPRRRRRRRPATGADHLDQGQRRALRRRLRGLRLHAEAARPARPLLLRHRPADQGRDAGEGSLVRLRRTDPVQGLQGLAIGPAKATQMCILVANPDHSVIQKTGNCVDLPS